MTRINAGIPPKNLSDKHLLAEHREIKRIPNHLRKHGYHPHKIPKQFSLGKGHVLFFIDKGFYTQQRYCRIYLECRKRGFRITNFLEAWDVYYDFNNLFNDWKASKTDRALIKARIAERNKATKIK